MRAAPLNHRFVIETKVGGAVMRYAFDELGLERLDGDIIEYDKASFRFYVGKCGWREEGRQRRWHFRKGRFWDRIIVGVTRDEYAELMKATPFG